MVPVGESPRCRAVIAGIRGRKLEEGLRAPVVYCLLACLLVSWLASWFFKTEFFFSLALDVLELPL